MSSVKRLFESEPDYNNWEPVGWNNFRAGGCSNRYFLSRYSGSARKLTPSRYPLRSETSGFGRR